MRMAPAMDHMDMDTDKPMAPQMLDSLSTPNQSVKMQNRNTSKMNSFLHWHIGNLVFKVRNMVRSKINLNTQFSIWYILVNEHFLHIQTVTYHHYQIILSELIDLLTVLTNAIAKKIEHWVIALFYFVLFQIITFGLLIKMFETNPIYI